jgi:hypothetical protein
MNTANVSTTSTSAPLARPTVLSPLESDYTSRPDGNGWTTFDVRGATGLTAPSALMWFLPLILGGIGMNASPVGGLIGAVVGFILGFIYFSAQSSAINALQGPRAPAGSFSAGPEGIRLIDGTLIPRAQVAHLGYRNVLDGVLHRTGTPTLARYSNTLFPIAFQVELESGGRKIPIVGCLNEATARGIFVEVKRLLDFAETPQRS